ncbi:MAG: 30S ribosomal protein S13 [Candidatus ainarchaeum sp.]|nr:30S ribosomal protein S13 [Candidatus ainarchaeum sp.]
MAKKEEKQGKGNDKNKDRDSTEVKTEKKAYVPKPQKIESSEGIVRIVDTDVSAGKSVQTVLGKIKGIGTRYNVAVARIFELKTKLPPTTKIGKLDEKQLALLEDIAKNPLNHGFPNWFVNKPEDVWDGKAKHLLGSDLLFNDKEELDRLGKMRHRKAIRRMRGLPVRGQKTKAGFRGKGRSVGVVKATK